MSATDPEEDDGASDLDEFSFYDVAPWTVDPDSMRWRRGIEVLRLGAHREAVALTRRPWLPPLRLLRVTWCLGVALLGWRFRDRRKGGEESLLGLAKRLRKAFERLGPAYVKLGQVLSSVRGLLPTAFTDELRRCRDDVTPETWDEMKSLLEHELDRPLEEIFASFDPQPVAAASIAQVHRAVLLSGETVVVKVQRPSVAARVRRDIRVQAWITPLLAGRLPGASFSNPQAIVDLFSSCIAEELDFRIEAQNMLDMAASLANAGRREIVVPRPHPVLVSRRVLVMEELPGRPLPALAADDDTSIDRAAITKHLILAFLDGAFVQGVFHGDLHDGNMAVLPDGRLALYDFGIVGRLSPTERGAVMRMFLALLSADLRGQLEAFRDAGGLPADADIDELVATLQATQEAIDPTTMSQQEMTASLESLLSTALAHGAKLPKSLMLYCRNASYIGDAFATLAPDADLLDQLAFCARHLGSAHASAVAAQGFDPESLPTQGLDIRTRLGMGTDRLSSTDLAERTERLMSRFRSD